VARFTVERDVVQKVIPMVIAPTQRIAEQVAAQAKENAPPTKNWVSMHDNRVRPEHVQADLDGPIPENLRFKLTSTQWDREHRFVGEFSYIVEPPHEGDSMAYVLMVNCRCHATRDPDGIRRLIHTERPIIRENSVTVIAVCEGDHVIEAELGTVYPGDLIAIGSFFMRRAAVQVAFKRRSLQTFKDARKRLV
jgi:hypothetical protein